MSVSSKGRRSRQEPGSQTGNETAGDEETGYEYPIASNVVLGIMADKQIEERINANANAISGIEGLIDPQLPTTLAGIETELNNQQQSISALEDAGFVTGDWVEERIIITERTLNKQEIQALGFRDMLWIIQNIRFGEITLPGGYIDTLQKLLVSFDSRLDTRATYEWVGDNYVAKRELKDVSFNLPWGSSNRTDTLGGFISTTWKDGVSWPNDNILKFLMDETDALFDSKLNKKDFDSFLSGKMTTETTDRIAFSLADVDVGGVMQNLSTALENRPTLSEIRYTKTFGWGSTWLPMPDWLQTVSVNLKNIKNYNACFRGTGNSMRGLTVSLKEETANLSNKFNDIMTEISQTYSAMTDLYYAINEALIDPGASAGTRVENAMKEIRSAFNPGNDKITTRFGKLYARFDEARIFLDSISGKAAALKTCGETNLQWPE